MADEKEVAATHTGSDSPSPGPEADKKYGIKEHWKCLAACTLVSMCPFQYGLDFGLIGGLQAMVGFLKIFGHPAPELPSGWNIGTERQQLISSLMTLGAFISSSAAGPIAGVMSRRMAIWSASLLCIVSNIIMMSTTNIGGLYAGRLLIGLANGMFMTFSQLYIQECSPARYRGLMISSFQVWTSLGSLVGTIVDNFTEKIDGRNSYLIPLGLIFIMPVLMSLGLLLIPESPRWLMQHGKPEQARKALRWHRPFPEARIDAEIRDIEVALETESHHKSIPVWDMFRDPVDRRRTVLAVCGLTVQGASGAMYMIAYGTYFFRMAGIGQPFENSCILNGVGIVAILINSALITNFGRRRVFLVSGLVLCGLAQLLTAVVYTVNPGTKSTGQAIVALAVIYIFGYNGMVATYAWVSGGELPSQRLRSYTFGLATAVGFFAAWLTTFTAPYFINPEALNWGPKYGYIWLPSCLISAAWVYFFLPEVKNRTLEEIDEMFEARLPAKKFRKYVCVSGGTVASGSDVDTGSKKGDDVVHAEEVKV
ncbi:general substrate transporter [Lasiosphaeria miniovina]|uniref:General substrate transporter n=1 Tax=Lasiosphaeria miniovina TaxID=1954250 RepID=A0AA40DSD8_9PEZI|nr:general substrate transporter [Lasiosphaeria miniovina]KAK0710238.1 general substrate transporter [Lasiosphaeria miniovina]